MKSLLNHLLKPLGQQVEPRSRTTVEEQLQWARNMFRIKGATLESVARLGRPVETVNQQALFDLHGINTVLDVGANHGQFSQGLRKAGFEGHIHCFEPLPHAVESLQGLRDPNLTVHKIALGAEALKTELTQSVDDSFSSLHASSKHGEANFGKDIAAAQKIPVEVRRLDSMWDQLAIADPQRCLLKSDTQGHDMAVLQGAGKHLHQIGLLVIEVPIVPLYEGAASFEELGRFLAEHGLLLAGAYPVSFAEDRGNLLELNAWYARSKP